MDDVDVKTCRSINKQAPPALRCCCCERYRLSNPSVILTIIQNDKLLQKIIDSMQRETNSSKAS
eukprot:scaffold27937_cov73-Cyclotella_meneghiniana.AAC.2